MDVRLRDPIMADVATLVDFTMRRYDLAMDGTQADDVRALDERWEGAIARHGDASVPLALVLVAEDSSGVVGAISIDEADAQTAELKAWIAAESVVGSAVLHKLLWAGMDTLVERGCTTVTAWLPKDADRLRAALTRDGFVPAEGVRPASCYGYSLERVPLVRALDADAFSGRGSTVRPTEAARGHRPE